MSKRVNYDELFVQYKTYRERVRKISCKICGKEILARKNREHSGYCQKCGPHKKSQITKTCQLCSSTYSVQSYRAKKTKYCSRKCANTAASRKKNLEFQNERSSKEHLLSKIKIDKKTGCWIWTGPLNENGYGIKTYKNKTQSAHRVFYEVFIKEIPKGLCLCHKCDRPACCNPEHMFIGTQQDNIQDMYNKKRNNQLKGKNHPNYKHGRYVK